MKLFVITLFVVDKYFEMSFEIILFSFNNEILLFIELFIIILLLYEMLLFEFTLFIKSNKCFIFLF